MNVRPTLSFTIIGVGNVGSLIAKLLFAAGYRFSGCFDLVKKRAEQLCHQLDAGLVLSTLDEAISGADIVFLTVFDDALGPLATSIAEKSGDLTGKTFIHTSGLHPAAILTPLKNSGAAILSFHPCISVSISSTFLSRAMITLEGDVKAIELGHELARTMNCSSMVITAADKSLYHLAASILSNFLVVFSDIAESFYKTMGLNSTQIINCLGPLLHSTVRTIEQRGISSALTGPFARGDRGTILHHLDLLQSTKIPARHLLLSFYEQSRIFALKHGYLDEQTACLLKEDIERVRLAIEMELP